MGLICNESWLSSPALIVPYLALDCESIVNLFFPRKYRTIQAFISECFAMGLCDAWHAKLRGLGVAGCAESPIGNT